MTGDGPVIEPPLSRVDAAVVHAPRVRRDDGEEILDVVAVIRVRGLIYVTTRHETLKVETVVDDRDFRFESDEYAGRRRELDASFQRPAPVSI